MKVADATGKVLYEQGVPLLWTSNDGNRRVGQIVLPDQGLTAYVVRRGLGPGRSRRSRPARSSIEVYQTGSEGAPIASQIVTQGQPVDLAGLDVHVRARAPVHRPDRGPRPGRSCSSGSAPPCSWRASPSSSSSRTAGSGRASAAGPAGATVQVGATVRHDATFETEFQRLVDDSEARPDRAERRLKEGTRTDVQDVGVQLHRRRPRRRPGLPVLRPGLRLGPSARLAAGRRRWPAPAPERAAGRSPSARTARVHEQPGDLRDPADLPRHRLPDRVARLPDDRHRPRALRQHVRVLDRLRLGRPRDVRATSSGATTSGPWA